jgi:mono/diheme cytochrome c family protein
MNFSCLASGILGTILLALGLNVPAKADQSTSLYKSKCAVCHGASGKGDTPAGKSMGVADLAKSASKSDSELKAVIEKGRNKMPAYGKSLKPAEVDGLIAYIKSLK